MMSVTGADTDESGTLTRVVAVRAPSYAQSAAATIDERDLPRDPHTHVVHVISLSEFEQHRRLLASRSLYYPPNWRLDFRGEPLLHDDMLVTADPWQLDDAEIAAVLRAQLRVTTIEVVDNLTDAGLVSASADCDRVQEGAWLSLGGWCGPAIAGQLISNVGPQLAFDTRLSGLRGIAAALIDDADDAYVPPAGFRAGEVAFNRHDEAIAHAVINTPQHLWSDFIHVHDTFDDETGSHDQLTRRLERTRGVLDDHVGPIFLVRAVTHPDWRTEQRLFVDFLDRLTERWPALEPVPIMVFHDQFRGTVRLPTVSAGIDTWSVQGPLGWPHKIGDLHQRIYTEYARIMIRVASDVTTRSGVWPPPPDVASHWFRNHHEHWIF